jgi:putative membrane protein
VNRLSTRSRSILKGAIAGCIGGLLAAAAKSAAEKIYPPSSSTTLKPPTVLTPKPGGRELTLEKRHSSQNLSRLGIGAAAGAAYGVVAELYPPVTAKQGANFGMALVAMTHDASLPFLGRAARPEPETKREQTSEIASFVIYGVVTETVRRIVRRMIA